MPTQWPPGPGELARHIHAHDWAATPLGPTSTWPQSLRTAVELMLASGFASAIHHGPDALLLFNDGWAKLLGDRHAEALGRSSLETFATSRTLFEPHLERARRGETVTLTDELFPLTHGGDVPPAWVSMTYSPLRSEDGGVAGVFVVALETTARHQTEAALRESEAEFRALVSATSDILYRMSPEWDEMRELNGGGLLRDTERPDRDWLQQYIHPIDQPQVLEAIHDAVRSKSTFHFEHRVRRLDGSLGWVLSRAVPLLGPHGELEGWFGAASDVTARKEEEVREREKVYRTVFESLDDAFALCELILDAQGRPVDYRLLEVNPALERVTGIPIEKVRGRTAREIAPALDDWWIQTYGRVVLEGKTFRFENRVEALDQWFDVYVMPVGAPRDGRFVGVCRDVSERKRSEEALRGSEARYRALVDNIRDYAILLLDAHGVVTGWTVGAERIKGYTAEEIIGQHMSRFYPPQDVAAGCVERDLALAVTTGRSEREGWRVRGDGTLFWAHEIATAIRDARGQVVGFTQVTRDLSEQRQLQEQREQLLTAANAARAQAEEANRVKDEFLATLSHELRTPLAPILLWSRALRSGLVPGNELEGALDAIVQSAEMQSRLIEDLLDLSRLQSNKLLLVPRSTLVEGLARKAFEVIRPGAQAKGVTLELDLPPGLGTAVLDPNRFQQILWNLLSNALKFTPPGGRVSLRVRKHEGQLEAEVADTGQGIEAQFLPHLFQRFRQADMGEKRRHTGLGIGLALCQHLVELHGGTLQAHSEGPGRGAVFTVRLPWVDGVDEALAKKEGTQPPGAAPDSVRGLRVLLVEDDTNTRDVMRWTLERAGAEVFAAGSGAQALALLEAGAGQGEARQPGPQVIVCDIGLPGMSGYEFIEHVVERCRARGLPALPACAVSAHAREVDRRRAIEAGFELYIAKPVSAEELLQAVEELAATARRGG